MILISDLLCNLYSICSAAQKAARLRACMPWHQSLHRDTSFNIFLPWKKIWDNINQNPLYWGKQHGCSGHSTSEVHMQTCVYFQREYMIKKYTTMNNSGLSAEKLAKQRYWQRMIMWSITVKEYMNRVAKRYNPV